MGIYDKKKPDVFTPFSELCKFADAYGYSVELEKPFVEMKQMFLLVKDQDGNEIKKIILDDIATVNDEAASALNDLSQKV